MNKLCVVMIAAVACLSACRKEQTAGAVEEQASQPDKSVMDKPTVVANCSGNLPKGIELPSNSKLVNNGTAAGRCFAVYEYGDGDIQAAKANLTSQMAKIGFRVESAAPARGGERVIYKRPGERINALIRPSGEVTLSTPGAAGSVYIDWQ